MACDTPYALFSLGGEQPPTRVPIRGMLGAMGNGKLILVRHGQSEWNKSNQFTGWVDVDLTCLLYTSDAADE